MLSSQVDREEPLYIFGPPKIKEYVESSRKVLDMYINYEIIVKEIYEDGEVFGGDGYSISSFKLDHTKPCFGYSLTEDTRPGIFFPEKAEILKVPKGPLWSVLQQGEIVKLEDGSVVNPEDVMGENRSGRKFYIRY
jgi:ribonuclease Z